MTLGLMFCRVLYNFNGQMEGDLTVAEGEVVLVKEQQNRDWVIVENSQLETGTVPGNYLDPKVISKSI